MTEKEELITATSFTSPTKFSCAVPMMKSSGAGGGLPRDWFWRARTSYRRATNGLLALRAGEGARSAECCDYLCKSMLSMKPSSKNRLSALIIYTTTDDYMISGLIVNRSSTKSSHTFED